MNKHIKKAIDIAGGQARLAKALEVTQPFISLMLNDQKTVPASLCMRIEALTEGEVTAIDILPSVFKPVQL